LSFTKMTLSAQLPVSMSLSMVQTSNGTAFARRIQVLGVLKSIHGDPVP
jgi:hypothetical protein